MAQIRIAIAAPRPPLSDARAVCERPHLFRRGATPRARRRGRSHHGLLTNRRRRGILTGGTVRRPNRGDVADNCLCGLAIDERDARGALTLVGSERVRSRKRFRTTYAVARLSPSWRDFSTESDAPTNGVS